MEGRLACWGEMKVLKKYCLCSRAEHGTKHCHPHAKDYMEYFQIFFKLFICWYKKEAREWGWPKLIHNHFRSTWMCSMLFPMCLLYSELKVKLPQFSFPLKLNAWQSSHNVAERERNRWKAKCLKQKINKSLLWFEWDAPDAGHRTKLHLPLLCLQPPPLLITSPASVQRNSINGWSVSCSHSSKTSHPLFSGDPQ